MKTIPTILLFSIFLISFQLEAHTFKWTLSGGIQDPTNQPLNSATITLLDPKDSTLLTFGISNTKGEFEIRNIREEAVLVQVSFMGFDTYYTTAKRPENSLSLPLGVIQLQEKTQELDEFTLRDIPPITIKKDTFEYHADAFKTQPNANVEELLKRLPGVEVDQDGTIRTQGETVRRVLVDGKEFFGNDPR